MSNRILQLNNLGQVALFEYNEETKVIGKQLGKYGNLDKMGNDLLDNYGSLEINTGAMMNLISLLTKEELLYLISLTQLIMHDEYVFYIAKISYYKDEGRRMMSTSSDTIETISDLEFLADYLGISNSDISVIIEKFITLNIIKRKYIVNKSNKIIYIINPNVFSCSDYPAREPYLLYETKEQCLTFDNIFEGDLNIKHTNIVDLPFTIEKDNGTRGSSEYRVWVKASLERDDNTCQCCGSTQNPEVHHILNFAQYKKLRTDLSNSITLCECCHSGSIKGSFHNTYGTRNNTKEQLNEYIATKRVALGLPVKDLI